MSRKSSETGRALRKLVVLLHDENRSMREVSFSSVRFIVQRFKVTHTLRNQLRSGRPRILTKENEKLSVQKLLNNPMLSAPKIAKILANAQLIHDREIKRFRREPFEMCLIRMAFAVAKARNEERRCA